MKINNISNKNNNLKLNKKAVSLPILLLVLSSIILSGMALFYFNFIDKDASENLINKNINDDIDNVYEKKDLLDFYINDIFETAARDFKKGTSNEIFLLNFKETLYQYKDKIGNYPLKELKQLEKVNEENIQITVNSVILTVNIVIEEDDNIKVVYRYEKTLVKAANK